MPTVLTFPVPLWLFLIVFGWAVVVSYFHVIHNPFPIPDRGQRGFAARNQLAAKTLVKILTDVGGLFERYTFDYGNLQQTVMLDGITVISQSEGQPVSFLSLPVGHPKLSAAQAKICLEHAGFTAKIVPMGDKVIFVMSDAMVGWALVFRRHHFIMPSPKGKRRIL
jgi:hypothetical protein